MSRRLNHYKINFILSIQSKSQQVERILHESVEDAVVISYKHAIKGHTIATCLKQIDKSIRLQHADSAVAAYIDIHVHHYTTLSLDPHYYASLVNEKLSLSPGSVRVVDSMTPLPPPAQKQQSNTSNTSTKNSLSPTNTTAFQ